MIYKIAHRALLAVLLSLILLVGCVHAQTITGKVVGVADGDTITVLQDRTQYKIRLYGIDCPESGQDFGNRAKQFVSEMVFGQQVQVVQKDMDRYGWLVGTHCFKIVSKTSWLMYDLKNLYCFCKKINATSFRS